MATSSASWPASGRLWFGPGRSAGILESLSLRIAEPKAMGFEGLRRLVVPDG